MRSSLRRTTSALTAAVLASTLGLLTACGGGSGGGSGGRDSSPTKCDLGGCTVTFVRDGTPEVSILGVTARLIGVQGDQATIEVAGQLITLPVGGETQAEGFTVRVERATDTEVVVRVSP